MENDLEIDELENLIKSNKLNEAFKKVQDLYSKQIDVILQLLEGRAREFAYNQLRDKICGYQVIPVPKEKHYVKNISLPFGICGGVGLILAFAFIPIAFLAISFLITFLVGYIGFFISLPICIVKNKTEEVKKPESWVVRIGKQKGRIDMLEPIYPKYKIECLKLDLLKYYWFWIISANKFGYITTEYVEV
ncbi:MAG: hypothetical protein ACTSPY_12045 [Candidatus Helarchaeota archaeon]